MNITSLLTFCFALLLPHQCFSNTSARDVCKIEGKNDRLRCGNIVSHYLPSEMFERFDEDVHGFTNNMKYLEISQSNISVLQARSFKYARSLSQVILSNISLQEIEQSAFEGLSVLKWVDLSYNLLKKIPPDTFKVTGVKHLKLDGNTQLEIPTNGPLFNTSKLVWLSMRKCNIQHLPGSAFKPNVGLSHLDLAQNKLSMLPEQLFVTLNHLVYLDLSDNRFQTLDIKLFRNVPSFPDFPRTVMLAGNPWECDCRLASTIKWMTQNLDDKTWARNPRMSRLRRPVHCQTPNALAGVYWNSLQELVETCRIQNTINKSF